jgi:DNA-3-methyladenine glycosylase II
MATARPQSISNKRLFEKAVEHLKKTDPKLEAIIRAQGEISFRTEGEMFESLVESILGQQLAWAAASAIIKRVRALYENGTLSAGCIHKTPAKKLRAAGVSPQKIRYLKDLSSRIVKGRLNLESLKDKPDADLLQELDEVLGIGPWTIQMLLIFTLGRPDVLPTEDLGIRKAIQNVYALKELPRKKEIEELAKSWHPYCSVASLYLWRHKDST